MTKADGRRERWRVHREQRRRELVRAVADVVRRQGADVGMDDIAHATGIAKQVFYRYFSDKADLHRAVSHAVARAVVREVTRCIGEYDAPRDKLHQGIDCYLRLVQAEPELYRFVINVPAGPNRGDIVDDYSTLLGLQVARLVGDLLRDAQLDAGAAEPWGFAIVGAVRAAADRWLANPTLTRQALSSYLSQCLWQGLAAATTGGSPPSSTVSPSVVRAVPRVS